MLGPLRPSMDTGLRYRWGGLHVRRQNNLARSAFFGQYGKVFRVEDPLFKGDSGL